MKKRNLPGPRRFPAIFFSGGLQYRESASILNDMKPHEQSVLPPPPKKVRLRRWQNITPDRVFPDPEFPLNVYELNQYFVYGPHCHHDFQEIVLITGGRAIHTVGGFSHPIGVGDLLAIPEKVMHEYSAIADLRYFNILYDPVKLKLPLRDFADVPGAAELLPQSEVLGPRHGFCHLSNELFAQALVMARDLHFLLAQKNPGMKFSACARLMLLLDLLARAFVESDPHGFTEKTNRLSHLADLLEQNPARKWTIADMCRITSLSRAVLFQEFQKIFQTAPMDYLLAIRMRQACTLLRDTDLAVGEIAVRCGFCDHSYFSLRFRRKMRISPLDFRRSGGK